MYNLKLITKLSANICLGFILFFGLQSQLNASSTTTHTIKENVEAFVVENLLLSMDENTQIKVRDLDPRLRIPKCSEGLNYDAVNYTANSTHFSIKVSCRNSSWFTFVNVAISQTQIVVAANVAISPGQLLNKQMLKLIDVNKQRLRGSTFANVEDIQGARLKRRIREGTIITDNMLCFVCKGDRVTVTASTQGLMLKTSGIAMEDGNIGDSIKIENAATDKLIIARVVSQGEVKVQI